MCRHCCGASQAGHCLWPYDSLSKPCVSWIQTQTLASNLVTENATTSTLPFPRGDMTFCMAVGLAVFPLLIADLLPEDEANFSKDEFYILYGCDAPLFHQLYCYRNSFLSTYHLPAPYISVHLTVRVLWNQSSDFGLRCVRGCRGCPHTGSLVTGSSEWRLVECVCSCAAGKGRARGGQSKPFTPNPKLDPFFVLTQIPIF